MLTAVDERVSGVGGECERARREDSVRVIRGLAHFLAHDLGNAISALSLSLDLLARQELGERPRVLVERCSGLQARVQGIVDGLGALGGSRIRPRPIELASLFEPIVRKLKLHDRFQVELALSGPAHPGVVLGEATLLELALRLLLRNAVEAVPAGGRLGACTSELPGKVRLTIWDEGAGVPPELRPAVFHRVFSTKGDAGVSLLLVRTIIEGPHGGQVAYEPNQPRGSRFHLDLPEAR